MLPFPRSQLAIVTSSNVPTLPRSMVRLSLIAIVSSRRAVIVTISHGDGFPGGHPHSGVLAESTWVVITDRCPAQGLTGRRAADARCRRPR